jgi:putative transposase
MTRLARQHQAAPAAYYHVMNRGHNREVVFADDHDHTYFLELRERSRQRFPVRRFHYCLMSNHFHLLVHCDRGPDLSTWMAGLLRAYVHYFHRRTGFVGHLWQGRLRSPAVGVEEYFLSCACYIERNPLAAGLVSEPWQYRWSSCCAYALGVPDPLLSFNVWYQGLGGEADVRQARWRDFLLGDDPREAVIRRGDWVAGDAASRRRLEQERRPARRRGRPRKAPPGQEGYFPQFYED